MKVHAEHPNTLGRTVRLRRQELGYSVRSAAKQAGISEFRWSWVERAAAPRLPEPEVVAGMAKALDVPPAALVRAAGYEVGKS